MAWTDFPFAHGVSKRRHFKTIRQLWDAVRERQWCIGTNPIWPRTNLVWAEGVITSLVDNGGNSWTLTDTDKAAVPSGGIDDGRYWNGLTRLAPRHEFPYWVGFADPLYPYIPAQYDVIIQHDNGAEEWYRDQEPWAVVRADLTASTSQTLTFSVKLGNYVTAGAIPSTASLVGKRYYLIKTGGLWWADKDFASGRYPDWPNHHELWRGRVLSANGDSAKMYTDGTGYLKETINLVKPDPYNRPDYDNNSWTAGAWLNQEVLVYDDAGVLRRLVPTGNDGNTVFFGGLLAIPTEEEEAALTVDYTLGGNGGYFTIVPPGSRGWPERKPWRANWWYGGLQRTTITHDPSDGLVARTLAFAKASETWESDEGDGSTCGTDLALTTAAALDVDLWTSPTNMCSPADHCFSPHFFKSLRAIQVSIENFLDSGTGGSFVRPVDYSGAKEIPTYSTAQAFADCGINSGTTSMSSEVDGLNTIYYFTVSAAYRGWSVHWQATKDSVRVSGGVGYSASDVTGKVIVATVATSGDDLRWASASIVYSAGWTRWHRLAFTHMYDRGAFIPDVDTDEFGNSVVMEPAYLKNFEEDGCFGVGQWQWREPSTGAKTYDAYGYAADGTDGFTAGKAYRYVGDNWLDPGTGDTRTGDDDTADLAYWDRFYEGQHPKIMQQTLRSLRTGSVTSATASSVTDSSKNWYADQWYSPSGMGRTESGVATGGSTTTLVTTTTLTDPLVAAHCWWLAARFIGTLFDGKPYKNFVLEVDRTVDGVTTTYKRVITDVTTTGAGEAPTLHFASMPFTVASGDVWRIIEPRTTLHRWRGKRVRLSRIDGTSFEVPITHSDDDTLFFNALTGDDVPQVGWSYSIIEHETGGVWLWQTSEPTTAQKERAWQAVPGGYWVQPEPGVNDVRAAQTQPWHEAMEENLAMLHPKWYGRMGKGDSIGLHLYNEMFAMLNRIVWTKAGFSWTSRASDATPENNSHGGGMQPVVGGATAAEARGFVETSWSDPADTFYYDIEENGLAPMAEAFTQGLHADNGEEYFAELDRRYAYGNITGIPNLLTCSCDFLAMGDHLVQDTSVPSPGGNPGSTIENTAIFDANGDPVTYQTYSLFETITSRDAARRTSRFGSKDLPNWGPVPSAADIFGDDHRVTNGYLVTNTAAILKWNVLGGLRLVDWTA